MERSGSESHHSQNGLGSSPGYFLSARARNRRTACLAVHVDGGAAAERSVAMGRTQDIVAPSSDALSNSLKNAAQQTHGLSCCTRGRRRGGGEHGGHSRFNLGRVVKLPEQKVIVIALSSSRNQARNTQAAAHRCLSNTSTHGAQKKMKSMRPRG